MLDDTCEFKYLLNIQDNARTTLSLHGICFLSENANICRKSNANDKLKNNGICWYFNNENLNDFGTTVI
jgi:hypothetical protein